MIDIHLIISSYRNPLSRSRLDVLPRKILLHELTNEANTINKGLYERYLEEAKANKKVTFLGRLGDYKYYDMDQAVSRALALAKSYC